MAKDYFENIDERKEIRRQLQPLCTPLNQAFCRIYESIVQLRADNQHLKFSLHDAPLEELVGITPLKAIILESTQDRPFKSSAGGFFWDRKCLKADQNVSFEFQFYIDGPYSRKREWRSYERVPFDGQYPKREEPLFRYTAMRDEKDTLKVRPIIGNHREYIDRCMMAEIEGLTIAAADNKDDQKYLDYALAEVDLILKLPSLIQLAKERNLFTNLLEEKMQQWKDYQHRLGEQVGRLGQFVDRSIS